MQCYVQKGKWTASRRPGIDGQVTKWPTWRCPQLLGWRVHLLPRFLVRIRFRHFFLNRVAEFGPLQCLQRMNENFWNFLYKKKYLIFRWFASQFLKKFGLKKIQRSSFIDSRVFFWDDPSVRDWIRTFRVWFRVMNGHLRSTGATSEWMSPSSTRFLFLSFCWPQSFSGNEWNIFFLKNWRIFIHSFEMFRIDCYRRRHCWLIWHFVAEERERERINSSTFTRWHTLSEVCSCRCFACIGQQVSQFSFWFAALFSSGRARFFFFFLISSHLTHFVLALRHVTSLAFCGSSRRRLCKFNFNEIPIGCDSGRRFYWFISGFFL